MRQTTLRQWFTLQMSTASGVGPGWSQDSGTQPLSPGQVHISRKLEQRKNRPGKQTQVPPHTVQMSQLLSRTFIPAWNVCKINRASRRYLDWTASWKPSFLPPALIFAPSQIREKSSKRSMHVQRLGSVIPSSPWATWENKASFVACSSPKAH